MSYESKNYADIIVIGAGLSGMVAAFNIFKHVPTLDILILEANSRIGGRTLTIPLPVAGNEIGLFDIGGQWLSSKQVLLIELLKELNIQLIPQNSEGSMINHFSKIHQVSKDTDSSFGNYQTEIEFCKFISNFEDIIEQVTLMNPTNIKDHEKLDSMTMKDYVEELLKYEVNRNFMRNLIKTNCGVDLSDISVLFYAAFCNGTQGIVNQYKTNNGGAREFRIRGGAQQICDTIANIIGKENIKKENSVRSIRQKTNEVIIKTATTTYKCGQVIIAIPPKEILNLTIEPPLPQTRIELLEQMPYGYVITFVSTYEEAFWIEKGFSGHILTSGKISTSGPVQMSFDVTTLNNKPALTGYIYAPDCFDVIPCPKTSKNHRHNEGLHFKAQVLQHLATYFGKEALHPISYYEKCWWKEPYVGSCPMSCVGIGTMVNFNQINKPIGRIFWAGTETSNYWNGYMAGAVIAGHRAAVEVLYEIRPQTVTITDIIQVQTRMKPETKTKSTLVKVAINWKYLIAGGITVSYVIFRIIKRITK